MVQFWYLSFRAFSFLNVHYMHGDKSARLEVHHDYEHNPSTFFAPLLGFSIETQCNVRCCNPLAKPKFPIKMETIAFMAIVLLIELHHD